MSSSMDLLNDHLALIDSVRTALGDKTEVSAITLDTVNRSLNGSEIDDRDMGEYV
jgi:hypothetical protein